jgi:hypothetical protein
MTLIWVVRKAVRIAGRTCITCRSFLEEHRKPWMQNFAVQERERPLRLLNYDVSRLLGPRING